MDIARFEALAEAYGADLRRWPETERAAAAALCVSAPLATRPVLAAADNIDAALDAWAPPRVSAGLREAVLAAAPRPRAALRSVKVWLSGAGIAAAAAAGVLVGVAVSSTVLSDLRADALLAEAMPDDAAATIPFTIGTSSAAIRAAAHA